MGKSQVAKEERLNLRISTYLKKEVEKTLKEDETLSSLIRKLLREYIQEQDRDKVRTNRQ